MTHWQSAARLTRRIVTIALASLCIVALTSCGNGNGNGNGFGSEPNLPDAVIVDRVDCQASNQFESWGVPQPATPESEQTDSQPAAPESGRVPADFVPVAATLCTLTIEPSGMNTSGTTSVTATRLEGDLQPLVAALAQPNDSPGANQLCTADMEFVPELWLEDATGHAIRAAWPRTACMKTKRETHDALDRLTITQTQTFRYAAGLAAPEQIAPGGSDIDWSETDLLVELDGVIQAPTSSVSPAPVPQ